MEKTTSSHATEPSADCDGPAREVESARVRIEEMKVASRERIALADIASFERIESARLDAVIRLVRYLGAIVSGRIRPTEIDCTLHVSARKTAWPAEEGVTRGRAPDVAPASPL